MLFVIICIFLLFCFVLGTIEEHRSADSSTSDTSSFLASSDSATSTYEWLSTEDEEEAEEDTCKEEDDNDDTLLAFLLAHDIYEQEKENRHAVCSRCSNVIRSSDDDGNEYCECPYLGWVHSWEADQERYCEHYEECSW